MDCRLCATIWCGGRVESLPAAAAAAEAVFSFGSRSNTQVMFSLPEPSITQTLTSEVHGRLNLLF